MSHRTSAPEHRGPFVGLYVCQVCLESAPYGGALGGLVWVCSACIRAIAKAKGER